MAHKLVSSKSPTRYASEASLINNVYSKECVKLDLRQPEWQQLRQTGNEGQCGSFEQFLWPDVEMAVCGWVTQLTSGNDESLEVRQSLYNKCRCNPLSSLPFINSKHKD